MERLVGAVARANPGALLTLVVIFTALCASGADGAAPATFLAGALLAALLIQTLTARQRVLARVSSAYALSASAALIFVFWTLATAAPLVPNAGLDNLAHPLSAQFGWRTPSISISPYVTLEGAAAFLGPLAAFALGAISSADRERRDWAGRWLALMTILYAGYALQVFFASGGATSGRLEAHIGSANAAGAIFGTLSILVCALIVRAARGRLGSGRGTPVARAIWLAALTQAPLSTIALILALSCALMSASRGALFATLIGFFIFAAILLLRRGATRPARSLLLAPVFGILAIAGLLLSRGMPALSDRLVDVGAAAEGRRQLLEPAWRAFLSRPLLGNGLNTYHELNSMAATPENWRALSYAGAAHNVFVQALEENGILGFALLALMLAPLLIMSARQALFESRGVEWSAALFSASALLLVHALADFELQIPAVAALFAFALGAFTSLRSAAPSSSEALR